MSEAGVIQWSCAGCGRPESETGGLVATSRAFRKPAVLCARCRYRISRRDGLALWFLIYLPAALAWSYPVLAGAPAPSPYLQWAGGWAVLDWVFVLLHEVGHAVAGRLAGYRIEQIRLGYGALVRTWRFLGIEWQMRLVPYGGVCFGIHGSGNPGRFRETAFVLGGPAVNVLCLIAGIALWPRETAGADAGLFARLAVAPITVAANAWLLLWSLLPITITADGRELPNDMLLLLRTWRPTTRLANAKAMRRRRERRARMVRGLGGGLQLLGAALAAFGIWIAVALAHNAPAAALAAGVVFVLCGGLMALVGRSVIRPRLRAARDMAATAEPGPLEAGLAADLEAHMDGMLPAELRALAARVSTQLEQGFHDAAIALVSGPSDRHPGNLALHMFAADIHGRSGNVDAALRSLRHAQSLQGLGEAARVALCHLEVRLLASAGRTAAAVAAATAGLALPAEKAIRVRFLDMLASLPLLAAHGEFLPQAEGWSAEAMALDPSTTIRATRAGVLYESGRVEEAEPLLREVSEESTDPADLGLSHMYLALLAEARGDRRTARRQAWIAFNHYPDRRLVERLASDGLADS